MGIFRSRKPGARYPSGKLKQPLEGVTPAEWGRIKNITAKAAKDARLESEIGRLSFAGQLTNAQVAAAFRLGDVYRAYHRAKGLKENPKSPNYERSFGDAGVAEERMSPEELERHEAWIRKCEEAWMKVDGFLAQIPRNVRQAIFDLINSTPFNALLLPDVRLVLDALAKRWGPGWRDQGNKRPDLRLGNAADNVEAISKHRRDRLAGPLDAVLQIIRPDLDGTERKKVIETVHALSAREAYRQQTKNKAS